MRISAEVAKHLIGSAERWFTVDNPVRSVKLADQTSKERGLSETSEQSVELEPPGGVSLLEGLDEFATEDLTENALGEKETFVSRSYPACVIRRQAAGGYHTVNMGMMLELLIPGVQDTEKANLCAEMLGVGRNFDQCVGAAAEQQTINDFFVLQGQRRQLVGQRKHDMSVGGGE